MAVRHPAARASNSGCMVIARQRSGGTQVGRDNCSEVLKLVGHAHAADSETIGRRVTDAQLVQAGRHLRVSCSVGRMS
jgi:hypothetical protein